jgi:hypothetical protein
MILHIVSTDFTKTQMVKKPKQKKNLAFYVENFCNFSVKLPWKFAVKVLKNHYGCEIESKRGSARVFIIGKLRATAHEPHGRESYMSKSDRQRMCKHIIAPLLMDEE